MSEKDKLFRVLRYVLYLFIAYFVGVILIGSALMIYNLVIK